MTTMLHIAAQKPNLRAWPEVFRKALREIGELTIVEEGEAIAPPQRAELIRRCRILITSWDSARVPAELAADRGGLEYICNLTGSVGKFVPLELIEAGIPVTNWGDAPAHRLAEGAMALLLAVLKDLPRRVRIIREDGWRPDANTHGGSLEGMNVGIYGFGVIGRCFLELLRPFRGVIRIYDPYVSDFPSDCIVVHSLRDLFRPSEAIVIHAGLSEETRKSVTAELLALLPDQAIIINTARGAIIDQEALFAELKSGRLRAGLDVLDPDRLAPGHPARLWENCILTTHDIGGGRPFGDREPDRLDRMHEICLDNIRRHLARQPLRFLMDRDRYLRST